MDKEIITEIRRYTDKLIRVDANEGWTKDDALEMSFGLQTEMLNLLSNLFQQKI